MLIKSALRDLLSVSYGIVSILVISRYAAPPYPAAPDFLHGKGGGASHQRGIAFHRPSGRLYGFRRQRRYKKWRRRRHTSPAQRYYITPEGGALNPPVRRQPITGRTLGAQGQRPGGAINPRPRKRASTFGNTGKHRPGPGSDRAERRLYYRSALFSITFLPCEFL